jgi:hypothetical protein
MPQASENRHPRIAIRTTIAKKPSGVALRDTKASPIKGLVNTKPPGNTIYTPPGGTIRTKLPERTTVTSTKRPAKISVEAPPVTKTSLRSSKHFVSIKSHEVFEDDKAFEDADQKSLSYEQLSDHSSHSHPVLAIGGLSESTKHMFMAHTGRTPATPPIPMKDPRRKQIGTDDTDADDEGSETFEDAIRSALATPGTHNYHQRAQTPSSIKSVRWDPAVVSYGRLTPGTQPVPDDLPWVSPLSGTKAKSDIADVLKTFSRLKKEDQKTLRELLQKLGSPMIKEGSIIIQSPRQEETSERSGLDGMFAKKLNPEAPAFRDFSSMKKQLEQQKEVLNKHVKSPHDAHKSQEPSKPVVVTSTPRKGLKIGTNQYLKLERNPKEPTWINIFNPPPAKDIPVGIPNLANNPLNRNIPEISQSVPQFVPNLIPLGSPWQAGLYDPNQTVWVPMPMFPTPHGFQALPLMPPNVWGNTFGLQTHFARNARHGTAQARLFQHIRRPPHKTKAANGPVVDVALANVPPEWGPGRVAQPVNEAWGQSLINQFSSKYPQTGKVDYKAKKQAPGQMRQAAAIQQQLELLIYAEKEKAAAEGKLGIVRPKQPKKEATVTVVEKASSSSDDDPFSCSSNPTVLTQRVNGTNILNKSWEQW